MSTGSRSIAHNSCITTAVKHSELQSKPPECSLLKRIEWWVNIKPDELALSFVDHNGMEEECLTYRELRESYIRTSHFLLDPMGAGMDKGDRCLLAFPPSLEFVVCFLACLEAGVIAVPVIPPNHTKRHDMNTFGTITHDSKASCCLTTSSLLAIKKASSIKKAMHEAVLGCEDNKEKVTWPTGLRWFNVQADTYPSQCINENGRCAVVMEHETAPLDTPEKGSSAAFPAFLQYTSGSISHPKGVVVSHENLQHALGMICNLLRADIQTVCVSWLPMFHDMGLIGSVLGTLYCGARGMFINTANFMKDPSIWVRVMSKERATHTQAPNFAYALTAQKWVTLMQEGENGNTHELHTSLDLSSIQHMINAAEPVMTQAMDAFYSVFCPYGLRRGVIYPTYGLAEHTLCVCTNGRTNLVADSKTLEREGRLKIVDKLELWAFDVDTSTKGGANEGVRVKTLHSSGRVDEASAAGVDIKIVGPKNGGMEAMMMDRLDWKEFFLECSIQCLPQGRVGEIWVNSPSKAMGYWRQPDMTREFFEATTFDTLDDSCYSYLRTGDIGLIHGEPPELFVLGRVKDLLIIRGRNHCPQDVEYTAMEASEGALRPGCIAAFNIQTGKERYREEVVALVAEVRDSSRMKYDVTESKDEMSRRLRNTASKIQVAVAAEHGCIVSIVSFVHPRTIPKTSSGKIARQWCARALVMGTLNTVCVYNSSNRNETPESDHQRDILFGDKQVTIKAAEMDDTSILKVIVGEVNHVIQVETGEISANVPISSIGMNSMQIMQLLALLEERFGIKLPEDTLADDDITLESLVSVVRAGGKNLPLRAVLFDCAAIVYAQKKEDEKCCIATFENAETTHRQQQKKAHRFAVKAKRSMGTFPDGALAARSQAPPLTTPERMLWIAALFLFEDKGGDVTLIVLMATIALAFGLMATIQHSAYVIGLSVLFAILIFYIMARRCGFLSAGARDLHRIILRDYKIVLEEELPWHQCTVFAGFGVTSETQRLMYQSLPHVTGQRMERSTGKDNKNLISALNNGKSMLVSCVTHAEASIAVTLAMDFGVPLVPCTHIRIQGSQHSPRVALCAPPILADKTPSSITNFKDSIIEELMIQAEEIKNRHASGGYENIQHNSSRCKEHSRTYISI